MSEKASKESQYSFLTPLVYLGGGRGCDKLVSEHPGFGSDPSNRVEPEKGCDTTSTSLGRYHICFKKWFISSWTGLVISHQNIIILFNHKKI